MPLKMMSFNIPMLFRAHNLVSVLEYLRELSELQKELMSEVWSLTLTAVHV